MEGVKKQLITGYIVFGFSIISGSLQVIISPFTFVRVLSLIVVIGSSLCVGAFIRESFILKKTKDPNL